jgi:hypothetical protein
MPGTKIQTLIKKYIESLSPHEKQAYDIAENHLESSFDVEKSIGFLKYVSEQKIKSEK